MAATESHNSANVSGLDPIASAWVAGELGLLEARSKRGAHGRTPPRTHSSPDAKSWRHQRKWSYLRWLDLEPDGQGRRHYRSAPLRWSRCDNRDRSDGVHCA